MPGKPQTTKRHHYLPESHLKRFSIDNQVYWLDVPRKVIRKATPKSICFQRFFYLTEEERSSDDRQTQIVEEFLCGIEGNGANALKHFLSGQPASQFDKKHLADFVASLAYRTPQARSSMEEFASAMMSSLALKISNPGSSEWAPEIQAEASHELEMLKSGKANWNTSPNFLLAHMCMGIDGVAQRILGGTWNFIHAPEGEFFVTGDLAHVLRPTHQGESASRPRICIPLTASCCLDTDGKEPDASHWTGTADFVRETNISIMYGSMDAVVSPCRDLLGSLAKDLLDQPHPDFIVENRMPPLEELKNRYWDK